MSETSTEPIIINGVRLEPHDGDDHWGMPSKQWDQISEEIRKQKLDELNKIGFGAFYINRGAIEGILNHAVATNADGSLQDPGFVFPDDTQRFFLVLNANPDLFYYAILFFPRLKILNDKWHEYNMKVREAANKASSPGADNKPSFEDYMNAFTNDPNQRFLWSEGFMTTQEKVSQWLGANERPNTIPPLINLWELRLGASRFFVPPINIQVSQRFRAGSLTGGALRQQNSPKFNSGHSDTAISMTIYFPNQETIWGTSELEEEIDFDKDSDAKIDFFLSSLRGLIAQFKYAPILPIRNTYLNQTHNITAVALQGITVQTMEKYPFCLAVTLDLLKFNHKVFLPMLNDFNQAVHWGRFRQYMGKAAKKMNEFTNQGFLTEQRTNSMIRNLLKDAPDSIVQYEDSPSTKFSKLRDLNISAGSFNPNKFLLYYPTKSPARVFAPDTASWRQYGENDSVDTSADAWGGILERLGFSVLDDPEAFYDYQKHQDQATSQNITTRITIRELLMEHFRNINATPLEMGPAALTAYIVQYIADKEQQLKGRYSQAEKDADTQNIKEAWFAAMLHRHQQSPLFEAFEAQEENQRQERIKEWQIPMTRMELNWDNVIVQGVSVGLGNNFARLQVQMQGEPVLQHIGGRDATVNVSMTIMGEEDLIKLRRIFEHVNGLARLEHAHGVLGFLGIKNVITTLCGMKYVLPLSFEVDTVPNYPHVYNVQMSFVDFDVFQQQREQLSSQQQKELIQAFGTKRNPFLRIKQLWGAFNAYPDFPLAIYEDELSPLSTQIAELATGDPAPKDASRKIIGHLDPDFYFRSFQTIDDDLVDHHLDKRPNNLWQNSGIDSASNQQIEHPTESTAAQTGNENPSLGDQIPSTRNEFPIVGRAIEQAIERSPKTMLSQLWGTEVLEMKTFFPVFGESQDQMSGINVKQGDVMLTNIDTNTGKDIPAGKEKSQDKQKMGGWATLYEDHVGENITRPTIEGLAPMGQKPGQPGVGYMQPTNVNPKSPQKNDPAYQIEQIMKDSQYRNRSGRMIRAFPTYMMWLIDEGGNFAGAKLFDNFYGVQSVIDMSINRSEDVLADTLVMRLSNLYSKLNTPYSRLFQLSDDGTEVQIGSDPNLGIDPEGRSIDEQIDLMLMGKIEQGRQNLLSGTQGNVIRDLDGIRIKPGVRIHLRMGYSANPNTLETVFNGTITQVQLGDMVEITAQSDAIELSPYINTTDQGGHSGKIDGALNTGLWLSEPRDLMVRLLSMGSSSFREAISHAFEGKIFSENKFGIRHFGQILYEPLTAGEKQRHDRRFEAVNGAQAKMFQSQGDGVDGFNLISVVKESAFDVQAGSAVSTRGGVASLMQSLWTNSFRARDYELFKRNIYPGNGSGVAQFLGGDFPEAGLMIAEAAGAEGGRIPITASPRATAMRSIERAKAQQGIMAQSNTTAAGTAGNASTPNPSSTAPNQQTPGPPGQSDSQKEDKAKDQGNVNLSAFAKNTAAEAKQQANNIRQSSLDFASKGGAWELFSGLMRGDYAQHPLFQALGYVTGSPLVQEVADDDLQGFDEVSFRAQTYMKSVWDMFQLCAALLPNYIVAVRPFEDRSTVFYGKPHWLYTSGVVPVTNGIGKESVTDELKADDEESKILRQIANKANPLSDFDQQMKLMETLKVVTPLPNQSGSAPGQAPVGDIPGGDVPEKVWNFLRGKGLQPHQAAGFMGNIEAESGFVVDINEKVPSYAGAGYGLVQWTGGRRKAIEDYARAQGRDVASLELQLEYLWKELTTTPQYKTTVLEPLMAAPDLLTASNIVLQKFEVPQGKDDPVVQAKRAGFGQKYLSRFGSQPAPQSSQPAAPTSPDGGTPVPATGQTQSNFDVGNIDEQTALNVIARSQGGDDYIRGSFDLNVKIWTNLGQEGIEETGKDPSKNKDAWQNDRVGHFARMMYDRAYSKQFMDWANKGEVNKDAILGDQKNNFAAIFKDIGQLQEFAGGKGGDDGQTAAGAPPTGGDNSVVKVAERIWDEFRANWGIREDDKYGTIAALKKSKWGTQKDYIVEQFTQRNGRQTDINKYTLNMDDYWNEAKDADNEGIVGRTLFKDTQEADQDQNFSFLPTALCGSFKTFMWRNAYARAWLVVTTSFNTSIFEAGSAPQKVSSAGATVAQALTITNPGVFLVLGKIKEEVLSDELCDWRGSSVSQAWEEFLRLTFDTENDKDTGHQSGTVGWEEFNNVPVDGKLTEIQEAFIKWLRGHDDPGLKSTTPWDRAIESLSRMYDNTIGRLLSVAGNTLQALITSFRLQLQQLGMGLDMVGNMQRQALILNKCLNDSIYYSEGTIGPDGKPDLLRLVDNPFTREYGEPVVEIREPFQRFHYIDSFQHILGNTIQENLSNVPTIITASSDGKYPVTVYFDRGAPSHLQHEKAVETGLFWDNAGGEGFFSFLHPLLNPIETLRGYTKTAQGSSDELMSRRVALYHLKEGLKDIYGGEIFILGDPDIRPHDLVYIADIYERMYGLVEVEAVNHHFNPDEGFYTGIVPNAVVTVNDPGRWSYLTWVTALWGTKNIRDDTRNYLQVFADKSSPALVSQNVGTYDLAESLSTPMMGHTTYHGGASGIVKDMVAARASGFMQTAQERMNRLAQIKAYGDLKAGTASFGANSADAPQNPITGLLAGDGDAIKAQSELWKNIPGIGWAADIGWDIWDWVKDNLLDQHGCYIQYLTRDGQPMDAGLSYAQGVAVGRFHTIDLLPGILGVPIQHKDENGNAMIRTDDLLKSLGWNEIDVASQYKQTSLWVAETNAQILKTAGMTPDAAMGKEDQSTVEIVRVSEVIDGDTIIATNGKHYRFAGVRAPELANKFRHNVDNTGIGYNREDDPGRAAAEHLYDILFVRLRDQGYEPTIAVRQVQGREREFFGRELGVLFHNVPVGTPPDQREDLLLRIAGQSPPVDWDAFMDDGQPYTLNWEMIMSGYAEVDMYSVQQHDVDRGASFGPRRN